MATKLRLVALAIGVVTLALWFFGGPNWGATRIRTPRIVVDAETGLERQVWEYRFLPGSDFLVAGVVAATAVFGGSFFTRAKGSSHG